MSPTSYLTAPPRVATDEFTTVLVIASSYRALGCIVGPSGMAELGATGVPE